MHLPSLFEHLALESQPLRGARTLPASVYADPAFHVWESHSLFGREWQLIGATHLLDQPGASIETLIGSLPVVVIRDDHGLRGFHNVCRHRAGPLAAIARAGRTELRCRYHGWTYTAGGSLRVAVEMPELSDCGFDPATVCLPAVQVQEWNGLILASPDPRQSAQALMADVDSRLPDGVMQRLRFHQRVSYEIACNWKVYVDNFLEGYHLPHIHPGLNRVLDYRSYRTEVSAWSSLQWSPIDAGSGPYSEGDALYWFVFPNTMLNLLPGRLQTNRIVPLSAGTCRVDFDYYLDPDQPGALDRHAKDLAFSDEVQAEDIGICEAVQRGLESGSYHSGVFNPLRESGVHHFHECLRRVYRDAARS